MTEPVPVEPRDQSLDELSGNFTRAVADVASAVIAAESVRWTKVQVTGVTEDAGRRFIWVRRPENDEADAKPYPAMGVGIEPQVNEWVHALETPGGLMIIGGEQYWNAYTLNGTSSDFYQDFYGHAHDGLYSFKSHNHGEYATTGHNHGEYLTAGEGDNRYAPDQHFHSAYLNQSDADNRYAFKGHNHGEYLTMTEGRDEFVQISDIVRDKDNYVKWVG
jgi:hypothetical protein